MGDSLNDLAIVPVTSTDSNYFLRKVTGLKIDKTYSFKFQWVLEDGSLSDWSPGYQIVTPTEEVPSAPTVSIPSSNSSHIPVTLNAFPEKAKRVDIYIIGGDYGTGKVADSFLQAGTKTIAAKAGTYQVSLITVSASGVNGDPTNTFTILITDPTANIQIEASEKIIPGNGVYATYVNCRGERYLGMTNIGVRPTVVDSGKKTVEVNIFDFAKDIYDEEIQLEFVSFVRNEQKFEGLDYLKAQLAADELHVRSVLQ